MITNTSFYFIRHGETDWNHERRAMGQQDLPLNKEGMEQAYYAERLLSQERDIQTICYSPLIRAKQTAEIINKHRNLPMIPLPNLKEMDLGVMEGELLGDKKWIEDWDNGQPIKDAETQEDFFNRAVKGVNQALCYPATVLIISHGGVYRQIKKILKMGPQVLPNCFPLLFKATQNLNFPWMVCSLSQNDFY